MKEPGNIGRHLLANFAGYLIVNASLDIPGMILAETGLSFLGVGLRSPAVSWGCRSRMPRRSAAWPRSRG